MAGQSSLFEDDPGLARLAVEKIEQAEKDEVYEIADVLLDGKQRIEKALYYRESSLFTDRPLRPDQYLF